ncbi:HTH-type transcriptional activator Btr [Paenibacillus solanacearum]|uniref:HTH-type transcriptional activator Btr n=1 Tax=Paenibacillus solanacearum TaxID=2048548 RepID=A0A916K6S2_9BACL|nr:AraC family transcriptional regulator [Paenibacillus solanacearum]CAG7640613.1 HTH-type transcriptional activator Btr [Paenibacillus solanacearum]
MTFDLMHATVRFDRIRLVVSGDFTVKPGWVYGPVCYRHYQIVYFPIGTDTRYVCSNKSVVLDKPCVIITPPGETYSYEFDTSQPVRHLFITFYWEEDPSSGGKALQPDESVCFHSVEETFVPMLVGQILYLSNKKVYLWEERCKLLLASALMELEGLKGMPSSKFAPVSDTKHSLPVLKALDYIDRHLTEPITIARLAEEAGWSHEHFTRKFVQCTGMSPQKAIVRRRIERACQLLIQEKWSISEIAYAVGFQNVHYFYRTFMSVKGMTASQYRQKYSAPHMMHLSPVSGMDASYPLNNYFYYS